MKKIYLLILASLLSITVIAQNLPSSALIYVPDSSGIQIRGMTPAYESTYILLCQTPDKKLVLARIDDSFNILWSKKYSFSIPMVSFMKIIQTHDSSLVLTGTNISGNTCILKLNSDGDILWSKSFSSYDAFRTNVIETADSSLMVSCHGDDLNLTATSTFVVKLNLQGSYLWGKKISGYTSFTADAISNTSDNQTLICGNGTNNFDRFYPVFFSLNANGELLWSKQLISDDTLTRIYSMTIKDAAVVLLTSRSVICTSIYGDMIWSKDQIYLNLDFNSEYQLPPAIMSFSNGIFYPNFSDDWYPTFALVTKLTQSGDPVFRKKIEMKVVGLVEDFNHGQLIYGNGPLPGWADHLGGQIGINRLDSLGQGPSCVSPSSAGSSPFNSTFQTQSLNIADYTPYVSDMTVTSENFELLHIEECVEVLEITEKAPVSSLEINPNPVEEQSVITVNGLHKGNCSLTIFDQNGRIILTDYFSGNKYVMHRGCLNSGIYFIQIMDENGRRVSAKIILH